MNISTISSLLLGVIIAVTSAELSPAQANDQPTGQPYAGQQQRAIKALT